MMKPYPIVLDLTGRRAVVIGGGAVAARKVRDLLECDALVTVVAPDIHPEIEAMAAEFGDAIAVVRRPYRAGDLDGAVVAFSAAGDSRVNMAVYDEAAGRGLFINAVDDPAHCTFHVPSWFSREGLVVAVSTGGLSPALAARVRRQIESTIPESIGGEMAAVSEMRRLLREDDDFSGLDSRLRGEIMRQVVTDDELLGELVRSRGRGVLKKFVADLAERYMRQRRG
jgi:precorrin-2 dehydrogenase/sirohydrochlorin ferrochelatase